MTFEYGLNGFVKAARRSAFFGNYRPLFNLAGRIREYLLTRGHFFEVPRSISGMMLAKSSGNMLPADFPFLSSGRTFFCLDPFSTARAWCHTLSWKLFWCY